MEFSERKPARSSNLSFAYKLLHTVLSFRLRLFHVLIRFSLVAFKQKCVHVSLVLDSYVIRKSFNAF